MSSHDEVLLSNSIFKRASRVIPGGVNSPVRAFASVGREPVVAERAEGAYLWDCDGRRYIDYIQSWGASIFGHAHPPVTDAITAAGSRGTSFGLLTEAEVRLAEVLCEAVPSLEEVRLVSSGTEATMSAVRLARGFTGRDLIVKFDGCYHGHSDALLAAAGSGVATLGIAGSAGVPEGAVASTVVLPYNDIDAVDEIFLRHGSEIAAVIVEPVAANMGLVPPEPDFLPRLRTITEAHGALLIFDEVITGFRLAWGGAQEYFAVTPDLTTLGKVIGGGLPLAAFGGRAGIMESLAPSGDVYQAGTLSGNPVATAASLAILCDLSAETYQMLEARVDLFATSLADALSGTGLELTIQQEGTLAGLFFSDEPVRNYDDAKRADATMYSRFFGELLSRGVLLAPSPFEAIFVSLAHGRDEIERTCDVAAAAASAALSGGGSL